MARDRLRNKGRGNRAPFLALNHPMLDSDAFCSLSPRAVKMLVDIARQYNGSNNGDLSATRSQMLPRGWTSNDQRQKAITELLDKGFLVVTRYGYRPKVPTLYAITWQSVDHCGGKLDMKSTATPSNDWKAFRFPSPRDTGQSKPQGGSERGGNVVPLARWGGR